MLTLLNTINNILTETGYPTVSTVIGNSNQTVVQALRLANRSGQMMAKKNWRILVKRNTFTTVSSAESYALPNDFDRFIHNTEWNTSNVEKMVGPLSDERWQADLSGLVTVTVNDRFQIRASGNDNRFWIRPVPTSAENVSFFYASDSWLRTKGGQRKNAWTADTDVLLLPQHAYELDVIWRLLRLNRRDYQDERLESIREMNRAFAEDGGLKSYRILGPVEDRTNLPPGRTPETGFGT